MPGLGVFYVAHLRVGQVEKLGQLRPVGGRLIKEQQKFGVGEHEPGGFRTQTFLDVLRCSRQRCAVFAPAFPGPVEDFGGIVILKIQIHFVYKDPGILAFSAVGGNPVLDGLQGDDQGRGPE